MMVSFMSSTLPRMHALHRRVLSAWLFFHCSPEKLSLLRLVLQLMPWQCFKVGSMSARRRAQR